IHDAMRVRFDDDEALGQSLSTLSFVRSLPTRNQTSLRGAFSRRLTAHRDELLDSGYLVDEPDGAELWRLSLRLSALDDVDYAAFVSELKTAVDPVIAAYDYRDQVLRAIATRYGEDTPRSPRILLLGIPGGPSRFADQPLAEAPSEADAEDETEREQEMLFSRTLHNLLRNLGCTVQDWHDPRFALPPDWNEQLQDYQCVVLIGDDSRYDALAAGDIPVVDARGFEHEAAPTVPSGADAVVLVDDPPHLSVIYTGLVPVLHKAQRTLLQSLIESTGWAFCAISLVMIIVLRNAPAGMLSMIPNVFPVVLIFGAMGWLGVVVDIGTMMTASVAIGVAVDDTIHFLTWFRHGLDQGMTRRSSIRLAYHRCATAMIQTTIIGGLGLSVYYLSSFTPTRRFGVLMFILLSGALIGDLIFLPALLASPVGRMFEKRRRAAIAKKALQRTS
ncbi:MAG: hypothetical protein AAGF97_17190, partial [Planctomycetota bacterium]